MPTSELNKHSIGNKRARSESVDEEFCAICLDTLSRKAKLHPCGHSCFDLDCITTWLQRSYKCPLCKRPVDCIYYDYDIRNKFKRRYIQPRSTEVGNTRNDSVEGDTVHDTRSSLFAEYPLLASRKVIYEYQMLSRITRLPRRSRFENGVCLAAFRSSSMLQRKTEAFLGRELVLFDYMDQSQLSFLKHFMMELLRQHGIDEPHTLLQVSEFLGEQDAKTLLHELHTFLKTSITTIHRYDACDYVVYGESGLTLEDIQHRLEASPSYFDEWGTEQSDEQNSGQDDGQG
ncbi:ubiquitin-protein ligase E3 [Schizosaccharomyces japonicus yFS275]|uniref:RING-type E3 ubiquitin transferase n=1 Tax=Schizosaccharomyces japonicus (strain yFS275 / FY16936) TaxID=402676 RepID=B6K3J0_SCHJY|nr:ubiquitin-protein ligase E3 [Schizosaccharomyces japonicus yFS275]EEB08047.1 ubiquitin-protein ligase E3 [Schizosaccharomyces japonicus yFS275]